MRLGGLLFLVINANTTLAEESSYMGAGLGGLVVDSNNFVAGGASYNVMAGYRLNEHFKTEVQFIAASDLEDEPATISPQVITASILANHPITSNFDVFGRLGVAYWQADITLGQSSQLDKSDTDLTFGAGFELQYSSQITLRQEYQYVQMADGNSQSLGFQFNYHF